MISEVLGHNGHPLHAVNGVYHLGLPTATRMRPVQGGELGESMVAYHLGGGGGEGGDGERRKG